MFTEQMMTTQVTFPIAAPGSLGKILLERDSTGVLK